MTSLRSRLCHGTAVAAALALIPGATRAGPGLLPTGGVVASGTIGSATATNATLAGTGTAASPYATSAIGANATLNLTVGGATPATGQYAIINWSGFDIAAGNTVSFAGAGNLSFSVLNRVQGALNPTLIAGTLQGNSAAAAGSRGTIFVINEAGVSFANSASVMNLTGFVASSLDVLDTDFTTLAGTPGSTVRFATSTALGTGTGTGTDAVHIDADGGTKATISPDSVLLFVAPKLDLQGGLLTVKHTEGVSPTAYGDAGFVLAGDAKVALNPDSIISIKIDKGTAVGGSVLNATVGGQRVLVAAASSTDLMASLLGVGGNLNATTATATDHGIVIAVGRDASIDGAGNSITFTPAAIPADPLNPGARFKAGVDAGTGTLTSTGRIDVVAGDLVRIGTATATGVATFTAEAGLSLVGNVSGGGIAGVGTGVTLGIDGATHSLTATGTGAPITLTASGGGAAAITTLGNVSITAPGPVVLQQSAGTAANVTQDDSLAITGSSVSLGNVAVAGSLPTAVGSGDVVLTANGAATTDALVGGTIAARSGVVASSLTGAVTLAGATSGTGVAGVPSTHDVTVGAARTATVSGAVTSTGNYTVTGGDVSLGGGGVTQAAAGDVLIHALTGDLGGAGTLIADSAGAGGHVLVLAADVGTINAPSLNVAGGTKSDVLVATTSDLALGTVGARQFASAMIGSSPHTPLRASDYTPAVADTVTIPGAIGLGAVTTAQPVTIASTGTTGTHDVTISGTVASGGAVTVSSASGAVTLAGVTSGGAASNVTVTAAGLATLTGAVTSTGSYLVSGSGVSLGAAGITQAAVGDVLVKSTATGIGVTGSLTADTGAAGGHVLVLDSNAAITGAGNLSAGSLSNILLAVNGDVALGTINANELASTATAALPLAATNYGATTANTLTTTGAITFGAVTTAQANRVASTGTAAGHQDVLLASDTSTTGGVSLSSANNVSVGGLTSNGSGDVSVAATGGIAKITGAVGSARDYLVTGASVLLGQSGPGVAQDAARNLAVTATGGAITAAAAVALVSNAAATSAAGVGNLQLTAATNIGDPASPGAISVDAGPIGGSAASRRAIALDVTTSGGGGSINLGTVRGASLTGPAAAPLRATGAIMLGDVDVLNDLNVTSNAALSLTSGLSGGNVVLGGTTVALGADGVAKALTTAAPAATVTLTASGGGAAAISTRGDFAISAPGSVVLQQALSTSANVTQDDSLAITGSSVSVGNIAVAAPPPVLFGSGSVLLSANGPFATGAVTAGTVTARNAVAASSMNGNVTLGGATSGIAGTSPHDVTVTAANDALVIGAVASAGDYTVTGASVTLSNLPVAVTQSAVGNVYARSGTYIYASGTLVADSGGVGGKRLVLDAQGTISNSFAGPVNLRAGSAAAASASPLNRSDILLSVAAADDLTLGNIDANSFGTATRVGVPTSVLGYTPDGSLTLSAGIHLGTVATIQSNTIRSTGTIVAHRNVALAGDTSMGGSIDIGAKIGAVSVTGTVAAHGSADLHADGAADPLDVTAGMLSTATVEAFGGNATLLGHAGVTAATGSSVAATGNIGIVSDGAVAVDAVRAHGAITVGGLTGLAAASLTGGSVQANAGVTITTSGTIDLTSGTIVSTERNQLDPVTLAAFDGAPTAPDANIMLIGGAAIRTNALASTGNIALNGTTSVVVSGTVTAGDATTATGSGDYTVIGHDVTLGSAAAGLSQSAVGNLYVRSGSNIFASGTLTADTRAVAGKRLVLDAAGGLFNSAFGPVSLVAGPAAVPTSDILLRLGSGGDLVLGNVSARAFGTATAGATPMSVGDYTPSGTLILSGAVTLGNVTTVLANTLQSTGTLAAHRDVMVASDTSLSGGVDIESNGGSLVAGTIKAFGGDAKLGALKGVTVAAGNPIAALGNVILASDGAIAVDAVRAGGTITVNGISAAGALSLSENSLAAHRGITVITVGAIDATSSGLQLTTPRPQIDADLATFTTNPTNTDIANIALTSTGSSVKAAAIQATGSITINAATMASVVGDVAAGASGGSGDYTVIGGNVIVGGVGVTQSATGNVLVRSTSTNIAAAGTLMASGTLVIDSASSIDGIGIAGPPPSSALAKLGAGGDVLLRAGAGAAITVGDITATGLASATTGAANPTAASDYGPLVPGGVATLRSNGAIALGNVKTSQSNAIISTGTAPGAQDVTVASDTSTTGSVSIKSNGGSVASSGSLLAATTIDLNAAGVLTVGDVTAQSGDANLTGGAIASLAGAHTIAATGATTLRSDGDIALPADAIRGTTIAVLGASGPSAASFVADSLLATGSIAVATSGVITLAGVNAASVVTRATPNADAVLSGAAVTINDATTTGSLTITATGAAMATGPVAVGDATTAGASGNYSVKGATITLGAPGVVQSATGNIQLTAPGAIAVDTLLARGTITAAGPGGATPSAASFTGTTLQANGTISVATTGAIMLAGAGTAATTTERTAFDPTLRTFTVASAPPAVDANVSLASSGGTIAVAELASTGDVALVAGGPAIVAGTVAAGDAATVAGHGNYGVQGTSIDLGGGVPGEAAFGNISLQTAGAITLTALRAGGTITASGLASGSAASLVGDSLQANGAISVATSGPITLNGVHATSIATERQRIDSNLGGFGGAATAGDAAISLTASGALPSTAGTITVNGATSTGNIALSAGTASAPGAVVVTGTVIAGDSLTVGGIGDFTALAHDVADASAATIDARHSISVTSRTNDALVSTAAAGLDLPVGGSITLQTLAAGLVHGASGAVASIGSGRSTGGDISALATGAQGVAAIASATAMRGNILADGDASGTVTAGTTSGTGDVTAHSGSGTATVVTGTAAGSVRALAATIATVASGTAANGNVDSFGGTAATITSGMAGGGGAVGNVRATSTDGVATITTGLASQSVVASGGSVLLGAATAGDDIILVANSGAASATTLTVTGTAANEVAATDASGVPVLFGGGAVTGLGGSNVIIRASGAVTVTGAVAITQSNAAKSANYDVLGGTVTLGATGAVLSQSAAGRVDITAVGGDVTLAGTSGSLTSNVGGNRVANAAADAAVAAGDLTVTASGSVAGPTITLNAIPRTLPTGYDVQANQPGVGAVSTTGSVGLAAISGGPVTVMAPVLIDVPSVTSWGNVALTGSPGFTDAATVMPVQIVIDGLDAGLTTPSLAYPRVNVTVAGGAGAEVASLGVTRGGLVGNLQVLSDTGAATLRAAPNDPTRISAILVESHTGVAGILNPAGGPATSANPNTVAAQSIVLRGRQTGSRVVATGPLLATGSILATGPSVTVGTAAVGGSPADGPGDIVIAATDAASLAAGATETAVARRTIDVTGGSATLGDGTATGGTLAVSGTSSVALLRSAVAGDDVVVTSLGPITAPAATIRTTGTADLQAGNDAAGLTIATVGSAAGTGYGAGHIVDTDVPTVARDATTGGALTLLAGGNVVATAAGNIDFSGANVSASPGSLQRDVRIESGGTVALATTTAARSLIVASNGQFTPTGTLTAGDDLVLVATGGIDVRGATLLTVGSGAATSDARRADGSLLSSAAGGGTLTSLGGSNIALAAGGAIQLGSISTAGGAPSSLRAFAGDAITTTQPVAVSGSVVLTGASVAAPFALTAGDDVVAIARGGAVTLDGALTTTAAAAASAPLTDLAGNGIALPGEGSLGRVDGSSILVAATGLATVSNTVSSAGRYSVYGRGGIMLGTPAIAPAAGATQSATGDILLEASIGTTPAAASITLASGMVLTSNSDGIEAALGGGRYTPDNLTIRLGNGSLDAAGATLIALRTPAAQLADQGTVQVQPMVAGGVGGIAVGTLDSARADLRAVNDVTIGTATVDAGLTLASQAGAVSLATLSVGTGVPLMTAAEVGAIDIKLAGATGATLGTVTSGTNLVRDVTVATVGGDASLGTAAARDDIVVTSAAGGATAGDLTFAGVAADSEAGVATAAATNANGVALPDPYGLSGPAITGLAGRNIVVSGATAASLNSVTTASSDGLGDVRVLTAAGPATLSTIVAGGAGLPARVIVATRNGAATATNVSATGDIIVDATVGNAVLTSGNAGRDGIVVAPTVTIGTLTAGDDVVAVATGGTLTAGTLTSTGANSGDAVATVYRADGTSIVDPVAGGVVGGLAGGNVVALASGDVTVTAAAATAAAGASSPGLVRIASSGGAVTLTDGTASAGDVVLSGATVAATRLSAGRDATITAAGLATVPQLTAGQDVTITAGSANLAAGTGLVAAQRNLAAMASGALTIGTARAGAALTATGGSVLATTVAAGDGLTVNATTGDATVAMASSTGLPLLADFSGFATTGAAPGTSRDIAITAMGAATLMTGVAVHGIRVTGALAAVTTATANTGGTDGDLLLSGAAGATLGTGSGRDVIVTGGSADAATIDASRDATVTATAGTAHLGTVTSGRDLAVTASSDAIVTGTATVAGRASLHAGGDIDLAAATSGDALDAGGTATLTAGGNIVVVRPIVAGTDLTATAGGAASLAGTMSGGATTIATQGDLALTADTAAAGPLALTSAGGGIAATAVGGNGIAIGAAHAVTITGATVSTGSLAVTGASIGLNTVSTALDTSLHAAGAVAVAGTTTTGGALTVTSDGGAIQLAAVATGGPAAITAADGASGTITLASLDTTGIATLLAGQSVAVTGLTRTTGALTATATNGSLALGAVDSGGAATLDARTGLSVAGLAKAAGALDALSSAGAISLGSAQATTITLRGATGVAVAGGTTATGPVALTADAGTITTGDIATTGDVGVTANGGSVTIGSVSNAGKLTVTAATDAAIDGAVNAAGDTGVTATAGTATIAGAVRTAKLSVVGGTAAVVDAAVTATGDYMVTAPTIALGTDGGTQSTGGTLTLASSRLTLGSAAVLSAAQRIELSVTGSAGGAVLGDGAPAAALTGNYVLAKADLAKLTTPTLELNAGALPVAFYDAAFPGVTSTSATVPAAFAVKTTGNIAIHDQLLFASTGSTLPRVLTLGGTAGGADLDKTTPTASMIEVLAVPNLDNAAAGTGGQINAAGSTVQLRATYIALGETPSPLAGRPFIDALLPAGATPLTTAETRTQYVDNASSTLYVAIPPYAKQTPAPQALVQAGTLVLAPGQWALIQNTGPTTTPGGGIIASTLKFNKVAGAAAADPEIAVFGSIAGKSGVASAISIDAGNLDGISPNNIRVNGCVALSTAGCIQSAVSIPLINLADPGRALLISSAPDLALSVELITGATNEALWREDDDTPGQNRPQRESRP